MADFVDSLSTLQVVLLLTAGTVVCYWLAMRLAQETARAQIKNARQHADLVDARRLLGIRPYLDPGDDRQQSASPVSPLSEDHRGLDDDPLCAASSSIQDDLDSSLVSVVGYGAGDDEQEPTRRRTTGNPTGQPYRGGDAA